MQIFFILHVKLENAYSRPQNRGFGGFYPLLRAEMRHHAKFCENRLNRSGDMADFRFLKMTTVHHLGFVLRVLEPPTKSIWWYLLL